ncbi:MAG: hypothetical protein QOK37_3100 [Thermoanaerobaculia bacterium]|nr:hypothetical protein [Thermoanaerobaculia bacterium]
MAQAAIRQSTPERTVRPTRRAARKSRIASSKTDRVSGSSIVGIASSAARAARCTAMLSKPCSTSWMTGRHVTISELGATEAKVSRRRPRRISIHALVSTRIICFPLPAAGGGVVRILCNFASRYVRQRDELTILILSDQKQSAHAVRNYIQLVCHVAYVATVHAGKPNRCLTLRREVVEGTADCQCLKKSVCVRRLS